MKINITLARYFFVLITTRVLSSIVWYSKRKTEALQQKFVLANFIFILNLYFSRKKTY